MVKLPVEGLNSDNDLSPDYFIMTDKFPKNKELNSSRK